MRAVSGIPLLDESSAPFLRAVGSGDFERLAFSPHLPFTATDGLRGKRPVVGKSRWTYRPGAHGRLVSQGKPPAESGTARLRLAFDLCCVAAAVTMVVEAEGVEREHSAITN